MRPPRRHTNQLMLFASGKELKDMLHGAADQPFHFDKEGEGRFNRDKGTPEEKADKEAQLDRMWERKSRENAMPRQSGEPLGQSVEQHGVKAAVSLAHADGGVIPWDGHHRIQAAADAEAKTGKPVWVPLNYIGDKKA